MPFCEGFIFKRNLSDTKVKVVQNLFWATLGKIANLAGGFLVGIFVARYLGPEQYGLMNYVISYVFLFQVLATFGLDSIEIREESKGEMPYNTIIGTAFLLKIFLGLAFMLLAIATSFMFEASTNVVALVSIYALTIVLNSFTVIRNYFTAIVQNKHIVKTEIARVIVGMAIKIFLLAVHAPLIWFIVASTFDFILIASGYCLFYRKEIGNIMEWEYDAACARYLLKESFPLMLTNAAVIVYQRIDQVMIGQILDNASVGFFSVAYRFVEILIYIPMILSQTIMPVLVKVRCESEEKYATKAQQFMNISVWVSLFFSLLMSVMAYWLIRYTFGTAYIPAVAVLQVMSFKAASVALSNTAGAMIVAEGLQKYAIFRDILGCIVCVIMNYYLLPLHGMLAAAYIAIISNVAAGYLADAMIPAYRHLFVKQTKAVFVGWRDIVSARSIFLAKQID